MSNHGKKIKIVNKMRFTIALFILLVSVLCVCIVAYNRVSENENIIYIDYVVTNGDTLWSIADIQSNDQLDTRDVVSHISKTNNISGSDHIYPGQTLKIPTWETSF